jgi:hexosaminidase
MTKTRLMNFVLSGTFLLSIFVQSGCKSTDLSSENLIPKPVSVSPDGASFKLTGRTAICVNGESAELVKIGQFLADKLNVSTGFDLKVKSTGEISASGNILLSLAEESSEMGAEGYEMKITDQSITLIASKPAGIFHGVQSLRQLLPAKVEMGSVQAGPWKISTGTIHDFPAYGYRGMMLDVARHFFMVDEVKRLIDQLAYYKMNVLHMHLSDDQGWRIEIKSWPNLTAHGGQTEVGGGEGAFYTQEQYSEIVKKSKDR